MALQISNVQTTEEKIQQIKANLDKTYIVADFDGTLTKYFDENGQARPSIISLLRDENILDEDYSQKTKAMYTKYSAIEHDENLSFAERQHAMIERWTAHKELLIQKGLNIKHIEDVLNSGKIIIRSQTDDLLKKAYTLGIPVIIFSASGIGVDSIFLLLKNRKLDLPNISIISNKLYRDETGKMIGYSQPVIHSLNKTEDTISAPEYKDIQEKIRNRNHIILFGDSIGDSLMATEKDGKTILKVGFCNTKVEERLPQYEQLFDIVITDDDGFGKIIEKIF